MPFIKAIGFHSQENLVRLVAGQPFVVSFLLSIKGALYIFCQGCCNNIIVIIIKAGIMGHFLCVGTVLSTLHVFIESMFHFMISVQM